MIFDVSLSVQRYPSVLSQQVRLLIHEEQIKFVDDVLFSCRLEVIGCIHRSKYSDKVGIRKSVQLGVLVDQV